MNMNKNKIKGIDLVTLFLLIIVYSIVINCLIDGGAVVCAICSILFVITYTICTVVDNLFENKKLNITLIIACFILLALIVVTFFI